MYGLPRFRRGGHEPAPDSFAETSACAPVAQLDRAPDYESGGQEFESLRARHFSPTVLITSLRPTSNSLRNAGSLASPEPLLLLSLLLLPAGVGRGLLGRVCLRQRRALPETTFVTGN